MSGKRSPDERSDIRGHLPGAPHPHVAALMRATLTERDLGDHAGDVRSQGKADLAVGHFDFRNRPNYDVKLDCVRVGRCPTASIRCYFQSSSGVPNALFQTVRKRGNQE